MNGFLIPGLYVQAGIMIYAAVHHLSIIAQPPRDRVQLVLAGICLSALLLALTYALSLRATDSAEFIGVLKWNVAAALAFFALFLWFVVLYTGRRQAPLLWAVSSLLAALFVLNLLAPYSLQYASFDGIRTLRLPWGEAVSVGAGRSGPWAYIIGAVGMATMGYGLIALACAYRRRHRHTDLALTLAAGLLVLASAQGMLVRLSAYDFIETGPLGILAVVLVMSVALSREAQQRLRDSEDHFRTLFEKSPIGMVALDPGSERIVQANRVVMHMSGYSKAEVRNLGLNDIISGEDLADARAGIAQLAEGTVDRLSFEKHYLRKDGGILVTQNWLSTLKDSKGKVVLVIDSIIDITERKRSETALRRESEKNLALLRNASDGIHILDAGGYLVEVSDSFCAMLGYEREAMIGMNVSRWDAFFTAAELTKTLEQLFAQADRAQFETRHRRQDGSLLEVEVSTYPLELDGKPVLFCSSRDITARKAADDEIRQLAFYDQLTRLPNRRLLQDRLRLALAASARSGRLGALLLIDLDNFKTLNDTLGHGMGDLLLQQVGGRLSACVREGDSVARLGGDEFVVMLEDLREHAHEAAAQTEAVGVKILAALSEPHQIAAHELRSTASIGAVLFAGHEQALEELLKQADIAMYQAKRAGRNALRFFDPAMQERISARAALEGELHKALAKRQFLLHYQVQVDDSGRPLGAEVLLRWQHPVRGLVSPAQFIALAEETGLILPIGQWVLDSACAQLAAWQAAALTRDLVLAVNISARQFHQADFAAQLSAAVRTHAIRPEALKLELTESLLLENIEDTIATMNALRQTGVRFSLDDFGTGYSSLQYLKRLPLHQLKIDQSFVRDLVVDPSDRAIVSTIVAMAQSLDLEVIAEGVESEEQRQLLQARGCTQYQGYLFGKPVAIDDFETLLGQEMALANV